MRLNLTLAISAGLLAVPAAAQDWTPDTLAPGRGIYVGVFGGGGFGSSADLNQRGTAFFVEGMGGPLAVNATGRSGSGGVGFVGGQAGYEWSYNSLMLPALELEGFYLSGGNRGGTLLAPSVRLPNHAFEVSLPTDNAVVLANMVLSFRTSYPNVMPYFGAGFGAAQVSIGGADSLQIGPPEAGVNHFNSDPSSSAWTFAAQAKAGIRLAIGSNAFVFGEYRYLFIGSTDQVFGSTVYPFHVATTAWTVNLGGTSYQLATAGIGVNF